jgi:hypothetical protein
VVERLKLPLASVSATPDWDWYVDEIRPVGADPYPVVPTA